MADEPENAAWDLPRRNRPLLAERSWRYVHAVKCLDVVGRPLGVMRQSRDTSVRIAKRDKARQEVVVENIAETKRRPELLEEKA